MQHKCAKWITRTGSGGLAAVNLSRESKSKEFLLQNVEKHG